MPRDLQTVLDAVLDGILVVDPDGAIERLNAEACRILEVSAEKVEGSRLEQVMGPGHLLSSLALSAMRERRPAIADDVEIERRIGGNVIVDFLASPLVEEGGAVIVLRDHTMRDALQDSHAQRDVLSSYGHIAAGIAHEVKNPLGGIRGAAELIAGWSKDHERASRAADMIVRQVDRIAGLVEQLMVFARGEELSKVQVNLHQVLDGVLDLLRMDPVAKGVEFERAYDPSIPEFLADPDRLTQVFLNLARNALQALATEEEPGRLRISTGMSLENRITDGKGHSLPTVIATVSDDGPGIPNDVLGRLATPFYTTREEGTGLGLAIARHWVVRHGGTVRIASKVGVGTDVQVALPLQRRERDREAEAAKPTGPAWRSPSSRREGQRDGASAESHETAARGGTDS